MPVAVVTVTFAVGKPHPPGRASESGVLREIMFRSMLSSTGRQEPAAHGQRMHGAGRQPARPQRTGDRIPYLMR